MSPWILWLSLVLPGLPQDAARGPDQSLPTQVRRLTTFGERADFSHDGERILFVEKTFGDVYEVSIATGELRLLTAHFPHAGYTRALYLSNGDILLSGPETFDPAHAGAARVQCFLSVLKRDLSGPPTPLGTKCAEGPAVSRDRMHIAWTHVAAEYPDDMPAGSSRIQEADLVEVDGRWKLDNQRVVLESRDLPFQCTLETQNFVPPAESLLTFSAYGHNDTDVAMIDLKTGKVTNLSNAPGQYDEPEGIFPDGSGTLVECDRDSPHGDGPGYVDLWKLALDGSGRLTRLTSFNHTPGYKASNGVVSDDGRWLAFQMAKSRDAAGVGYGIFLLDLTEQPPR